MFELLGIEHSRRTDCIFEEMRCIVEKSGSVVRYYHTDHLGSTRLMTDSQGNTVVEYKYYPYGANIAQNIQDPSFDGAIYRFTGKGDSPSTGLYYFGARFYDPKMGRFITLDPARDGLNWYEYCRSNPLVYVDPDGEFVSTIFGAVVGGIVGGVNAWRHKRDIRTGIVSGAVSGAVVGASVDIVVATGGAGLAVVGGAAAGGGIGGFLGNVIDQVGNQMALGEDFTVAVQHIDFKSAGISASIGVVSGAAGGATSVALSKLVPVTHDTIRVSMNHMETNSTTIIGKRCF